MLLVSSLRAVIALQTAIVNQYFSMKILFEHLAHETLFNDHFDFESDPSYKNLAVLEMIAA